MIAADSRNRLWTSITSSRTVQRQSPIHASKTSGATVSTVPNVAWASRQAGFDPDNSLRLKCKRESDRPMDAYFASMGRSPHNPEPSTLCHTTLIRATRSIIASRGHRSGKCHPKSKKTQIHSPLYLPPSLATNSNRVSPCTRDHELKPCVPLPPPFFTSATDTSRVVMRGT